MSDATVVVALAGGEERLTMKEISSRWERGLVTRATPMWSERRREWSTVSEIFEEMYPETGMKPRIAQMKSAGIKRVDFLGTNDGRDCPVCLEIQSHSHDIDADLSLPPAGCTCEPWCRCVCVASEGVAKNSGAAQSASMKARYHVKDGGKITGPYEVDLVMTMIGDGRITGDALFRRYGTTDWLAAVDLAEEPAEAPEMRAVKATPPPPVPAQRVTLAMTFPEVFWLSLKFAGANLIIGVLLGIVVVVIMPLLAILLSSAFWGGVMMGLGK